MSRCDYSFEERTNCSSFNRAYAFCNQYFHKSDCFPVPDEELRNLFGYETENAFYRRVDEHMMHGMKVVPPNSAENSGPSKKTFYTIGLAAELIRSTKSNDPSATHLRDHLSGLINEILEEIRKKPAPTQPATPLELRDLPPMRSATIPNPLFPTMDQMAFFQTGNPNGSHQVLLAQRPDQLALYNAIVGKSNEVEIQKAIEKWKNKAKKIEGQNELEEKRIQAHKEVEIERVKAGVAIADARKAETEWQNELEEKRILAQKEVEIERVKAGVAEAEARAREVEAQKEIELARFNFFGLVQRQNHQEKSPRQQVNR